MNNVTFSLLQTLQLSALIPCFFVIGLLIIISKKPKRILLPVLYFISLSASFMHPLLPVIGFYDKAVLGALLFIESLQPALCFLIVVQFMTGHVPKPLFWLILAVPVIGGSSFIYGKLVVDELCLFGDFCATSDSVQSFYNVISSSLVFLLLMVHFSRSDTGIPVSDRYRQHKYWVVMALILLNLVLLSNDLAVLAESISSNDSMIIATVIRIAFIYLIITSLFRVFDEAQSFGVSRKAEPKPVDQHVITKIEVAMQEHVYREMGCSRESLAKHLDIPEHVLSRSINEHFGKNFNEFLNYYRVEEAKERLSNEATPVTVIAFEVGFSSIASFNRVFKSVVGCSPTEFRAKQGT